MVKLKDNEIENRLAEEDITEVKNVKEVGDDVSVEEFSIENYSDGSYQTVFGEELKKGMSYSPKMLDINELFEEGVVKRGDKIDLTDFPEIETIQAATQEQLNMLTPESREQISAIHLSNNTSVGWDDKFDYSNRYPMDRELDLTDFENVTEVQTHFYVNDELENIKLPEGVNEVLCRHSKMKNLSNEGDLKDVNVILDRAETAFDFDDGMSGYDYDEYEEPVDEFYQLDNYHSVQEENGSYTLYYQDVPVLKNLDAPAEVTMPTSTAYSSYEDNRFNFASLISINDDWYAALQLEGDTAPKFYLRESGEDLGRNCTKVTFTNSLNPDEKVNSLEITQFRREGVGGSFDRESGLAITTLRRDISRGYTPGGLTMYTKHDGEYVGVSRDFCDSPEPSNYVQVYSNFLKMLDEKGISLPNEEKEAKENIVFNEIRKIVYCDMAELQQNIVIPRGFFDFDNYHSRVNEMINETQEGIAKEIKTKWDEKTPLDKVALMLEDNNISLHENRDLFTKRYYNAYRLGIDNCKLLKSILDEGVDLKSNPHTTEIMRMMGYSFEENINSSYALACLGVMIERGARYGDEQGRDSSGKTLEDYEWGRCPEVQRAIQKAKEQESRIAEKQGKVQEWKQHRNDDLLKGIKAKVSAGNETAETEKSHDKPRAKVSQNVKSSKGAERE